MSELVSRFEWKREEVVECLVMGSGTRVLVEMARRGRSPRNGGVASCDKKQGVPITTEGQMLFHYL